MSTHHHAGSETANPMLVTSLPTPAAARLRRIVFAAVLVATHVLIGTAGWALSTTGMGLSSDDTAGPATGGGGRPAPTEGSTVDATDPTGILASEPATAPDDGGSVDDGAVDDSTIEALMVAPSGASYFVDVPTTRVLDTRGIEPVPAGGTASINLAAHVSPEATAVALSVAVLAPPGPGPVSADMGAGPIRVTDVNTPMASNLVFVPRVGVDTVTLTVAGGGHVVADVVGYFQPSPAAAEGRFVPVAPQPIGRLWTETQGRQTTLTVADTGALPSTGVSSVLVRIRADVGGEGGQVRLGPTPDDLPNTMFWSPTSDGDRTRQGVAIVTLDELGQLSLDYAGGTELNVDLLGYFTSAEAEVSTAGLFVPVPATTVFEAALPARTATVVDVAEYVASGRAVSAVAMTVTARADKPGDLLTYNAELGLPRSTTLDVGGGVSRTTATAEAVDSGGRVLLFSEVELDIAIESTGYFLAG